LSGASFFYNVLLPWVTSLTGGLIFGKYFIDFASSKLAGQPIRICGPANHIVAKANTPSLGGFIIFLIPALWALLSEARHLWFLLATVLCYGALGFIDDRTKIKCNNSDGISPLGKIVVQVIGAGAFVFFASHAGFDLTRVLLPLYGYVDIGFAGPVLGAVTIVATANAVNLTDGLDGLVALPLVTNAFFLALATAGATHQADLCVLATSFAGGVLAFLWYNAHPARIFMGDCGSMGSGCLIACISVLLGVELMLIISGFVFVVSAASTMLQLASFKIRKGKRLFLMAPLHHHFEKMGHPETRIVTRFWIVSVVCFLVAVNVFMLTTYRIA
jgi:phospho-N-acetylmuramoyl-pentapeptide-transferase